MVGTGFPPTHSDAQKREGRADGEERTAVLGGGVVTAPVTLLQSSTVDSASAPRSSTVTYLREVAEAISLHCCPQRHAPFSNSAKVGVGGRARARHRGSL